MTDEGSELRRHWRLLLASFVGVMTGVMSVPFYILGSLIKPLQAEYGWSQTAILLCVSFVAAGVTISSPLAGKLVDRFEPRRVASISMILLGICLLLAGQITGPVWQLQLLYFLMGLLGAGCGGITFSRAIGTWAGHRTSAQPPCSRSSGLQRAA